MRSVAAGSGGYDRYSLDELLVFFVTQQDPVGGAAGSLDEAITLRVDPIIRRELSSQLTLSRDRDRQILEEGWERAMVGLWSYLAKKRVSGNGDFLREGATALVRSIAQRSRADFYREESPGFQRLQSKVAYLLDRCSERCGFEVHKALFKSSRSYWPAGVKKEPGGRRCWDRDEFRRCMLGVIGPEEIGFAELIRMVLQYTNVPMGKAEIVLCLRDLVLAGQPPMCLADMAEEVSDEDRRLRDVETAIETGRSLEWLWQELEQLPVEQLQSIILRIDPEGLAAFAAQVGFDRMAAAVDVEALTLVKLANRTPLEFEEIASLIGISSQQARDRRKKGWQRIQRRYRAWCDQTRDSLNLLEMWLATLRAETEGAGIPA